MQIIKDKNLTDDNWIFINDDTPLPETGDITISLKRWETEASALQTHNGKIGLRLTPTDNIRKLTGKLQGIELIELDFPAFTDGRGFSQARLLRDDLGFVDEIRATGNYMADQAFYMSRVGINAFAMRTEKELKTALSTLNDFTVEYQASTH